MIPVLIIVLLLVLVWPTARPRRRGPALFGNTGPQWRRMYGRRALLRFGAALGAAAVLAYSGADEAFDRWHGRVLDTRESRGGGGASASSSDRVAELVKWPGERFWFGAWLLAAAGDWLWASTSFSRWGRDNFEAMCVGLPLLWTTQRGLGTDRPTSDGATPRWQPFAHAHGASGHAFMGAIPWWTLAQRLDPRIARWSLRGIGALTGWSRLNDRKHYLSQVLMGWTIAGNAVVAVRPRPARAAEEAARGAVSTTGDRGLRHS